MKGKSVLITGGAGSLGQALTTSLLKREVSCVKILDNSEYFLTDMQSHLKDPRLKFHFGDIKDKYRLRRAMRNVDIVIHAAALKHVPICEDNPIEAIKANIDGSINVIETAAEAEVEKVLFISSDKAVYPINVYGATKLMGERLFIQSNIPDKTKFSCVRFGNFWGSRGSVIPLWFKQREGGVITLTEKEMSRFWITIDEATSFAISCIKRMEGGEIFIPIMPTHTLEEIASSIAPECKIRVIGRRRGEKLHEMLMGEGEEKNCVRENDCYIIKNVV